MLRNTFISTVNNLIRTHCVQKYSEIAAKRTTIATKLIKPSPVPIHSASSKYFSTNAPKLQKDE